MQIRTKTAYRYFPLFIALSIFLLLFSENGIRCSDDRKENTNDRVFSISDLAVSEASDIAYAEELLPIDISRLVRYHSSKGVQYPKSFICCLNSGCLFLIAAYILFVFLNRTENVIFFSRRYIIKYIHDQDGHKI